MRPAVDRFMDKVMPEPMSGCWLWTGCALPSGYGNFRDGGGMTLAHRFAYGQFVGAIPSGGVVMHKCDTPCCVNPEHLSIGTHADNVADKVKKGRQRGPKQKTHCSKCRKLLSGSNLRVVKDTRGGYRRCAQCYREYQRNWKRMIKCQMS